MLKFSVVTTLVLAVLVLAACGESGGSGPTADLEQPPVAVDPASPRAVFDTYRQAMKDGDIEALMAVLAPSAREAMSKEDAAIAMRMIRAFMPTEETVTGVQIDGETATIKLTSENDGKTVAGTVAFVREDGAWKVHAW